MNKPTPVLSYATPRRERRQSLVDWSARLLGAAQLLVALLLLIAALATLGRAAFSAGPWAARLAWHWFPRCAVLLNAVAAVTAVRGAVRLRGQQGPFLGRYVWICLCNICLTVASLAILSHVRLYVSNDPSAPPVNDHRFVLDSDLYVRVPIVFLICNPVLILLVVRQAARPWAEPPRSPLDIAGVRTDVTLDEIVAMIHDGRDRPRSPLDVGYIVPRRPLTTEDIVAAVREGRDRG